MPEPEYNATIVQRVEIAPGLIILRIVPDTLPFNFKAGQYTVLGLKRSAPRVSEASEDLPPSETDDGKLIRRAYSIASSSRADEFVEFYLTLVSSGELSPRLFALGIKDRIWVGPKCTGLFTLDRIPAEKHVLLVATGTGLAPYMSMLRSELVCGGPRFYIVLHGARFSWDLGYRTELTALARHCKNLIYLPVVSRPQEDGSWKGLSGYLQDVLVSGAVTELSGIPLDPAHLDIFLCGNPGMIEASRQRLVELGFVPDHRKEVGTIHTEEYW